MANRTRAIYSSRLNDDINQLYIDNGDGTYSRQVVGASDGTTNFVGVEVFDQSANDNIQQKYILTAGGTYARAIVGA